MCVYLRIKFQFSSIILTSFRQGVILPSPTSKRTFKKPIQIRIRVLTFKDFTAINILVTQHNRMNLINEYSHNNYFQNHTTSESWQNYFILIFQWKAGNSAAVLYTVLSVLAVGIFIRLYSTVVSTKTVLFGNYYLKVNLRSNFYKPVYCVDFLWLLDSPTFPQVACVIKQLLIFNILRTILADWLIRLLVSLCANDNKILSNSWLSNILPSTGNI